MENKLIERIDRFLRLTEDYSEPVQNLLKDCKNALQKPQLTAPIDVELSGIIESLGNIALTAQQASMHEPMQFCEYAYNSIGEVINQLQAISAAQNHKPVGDRDGK